MTTNEVPSTREGVYDHLIGLMAQMARKAALLDLAQRALASSKAGQALHVSPDEFRLLKTMHDQQEWDAVVLAAWRAALQRHPMSKDILGGVIGQPWALPVIVDWPS